MAWKPMYPDKMTEAETNNAIRIAKEMLERGESDGEILDTLSKTFEAKISELQEIIEAAKKLKERP